MKSLFVPALRHFRSQRRLDWVMSWLRLTTGSIDGEHAGNQRPENHNIIDLGAVDHSDGLTYYQKQVPLCPFPSTFEPLFSPTSCKSRHLLWQFYTRLNGLRLLTDRLHDLD